MSGRRLLDAITLLNATRNVAAKHLALQRKHLDIHARTSSLTKEIKSQSDRLGLALKAATELARKLDDSSPSTATGRANVGAEDFTTAEDGRNFAENSNSPEIRNSEGLDEGQEGVKISSTQAFESEYAPKQDAVPPKIGSDERSAPKTTEPLDDLSNTTTSNVTGSTNSENAVNREELPDDMVKQLFRSQKMSNSIYRNRHGGKSFVSDEMSGRSPLAPGFASAQRTTGASHPASSPVEPKSNLATMASAQPTEQDQNPINFQEIHEETAKIDANETPLKREYQMVESRIPSSRLGRLWEYGGLATSMAFGIMGESIRRVAGSDEASTGSLLLNPANIERLVAKLSKMRGAALKLGQMLSFQDSKMLPPTIQEVLQRVQDRADYMPASQRDKVLTDNLGSDWRNLFATFDEVPMAAASIGQVHGATLKETGQRVAVKVQYPGVADSIDSDLKNLSILLTASRLLPKGLYLDKTIANARIELAWECDYIREAECGQKFRQFLQDDTPTFLVPEIVTYASGKQVLTMERMDGIAVTKIQNFTQGQRDWIGTQILRLCLREICEFRYMQTDPNWTNFLYNAQTNRLELLDFGASRAYPASFIITYIRILLAASRNDREMLHELSLKLGYLTGFESQAMINAHIDSILTLAEPFRESSPDIYDFSDQTITERVKELIPLMLRERLAPPPEETYSLHRKLSGAFLLCARLGSRVPCRELFANALSKVEWDNEEGNHTASAN
ncbi:hypothetical protein D8B26_000707 [Coccidioides posadasii str. Silveira]|uniref:Uncharacterized protein n=1 Tax=Coccidioides posadasii (strain RMSCC 757 / Silveira) TaxID=443226 RepID=E9D8N2_COCPS|nr:hypothetical protein CPSG_06184 [Coccidioides posadasii str. Silveira]QVM05997.1 hypothetical protein D8B26_000707 [Coccidioides posadasii str. Silveira]